jgi:hypothetical protein
MAQPIVIPNNSVILPVNLSSSWKTITLPVVSTNPGRFLIFKDLYGNATTSSLRLSTTGVDTIERDNVRSVALSNAYGAWWFTNDGLSRWFLTDAYLNTLYLSVNASSSTIPLNPGLRYSFLAANYSGSGAVSNIGSNSAIGTGTVSRNSYTATSPGFVTNVRASQYVLASSVTNLRTVIMICRIRDTAAPSYFLDGRSGMANGWIYDNTFGGDWNSATYYKDCVSTALQLPGGANDNQWHHNCLITASAYTSAITFANRFSLNEGMGCDIAEIMVFTQVLTLQQVKDNFNFFASRFGWTPVS